jgi:hypothetical protein
MKQAATLTTADIRFIDGIVEAVLAAPRHEGAELTDEVDGWQGSSAWVRQQFAEYLLHAMACADRARGEPTQANIRALGDFNLSWFNQWRTTKAYAKFCHRCDVVCTQNGVRPSVQRASAGWTEDPAAACNHICAGALKMTDLSRRARQFSTAQFGPGVAEQRTKQMRAALQSSGKVRLG